MIHKLFTYENILTCVLEEILEAVEYARIQLLMRELAEIEWHNSRRFAEECFEQDSFDVQRSGEAAILSGFSSEPFAFAEDIDPAAERNIVVYGRPDDEEVLAYVIDSSYAIEDTHSVNKPLGIKYESLVRYNIPKTNIFYVHVPPWASVRRVDSLELGEHVLGTANITNGEIRLLHTLDPAQTTEVLLHETLHLLYPAHGEKQIRDMVRNIMGKQYCCFH